MNCTLLLALAHHDALPHVHVAGGVALHPMPWITGTLALLLAASMLRLRRARRSLQRA